MDSLIISLISAAKWDTKEQICTSKYSEDGVQSSTCNL